MSFQGPSPQQGAHLLGLLLEREMADAGASTDLSTSQMSQGSNGVLQAKLARRKLQVRAAAEPAASGALKSEMNALLRTLWLP